MKERILTLLAVYPNGLTPTEIGMTFGFVYTQASSRVNSHLKTLKNDGKIIRVQEGKKITYKLN